MPSLTKDIREVLTANASSMGNSGGMTDVKINAHSSKSLYRLRLGSFVPSIQTYEDAAIANTNRNRMNKNVSRLFAVTLLTLYIIVLKSFPWDVLKPVLST